MDITDLPSVRRALHGTDAARPRTAATEVSGSTSGLRHTRLLTAYGRVMLLLKEREALTLALQAAREELREAVHEANNVS